MRREFDYKKVPMSKLRCPMCKEELNIHFDAFTVYNSVAGPYVKGRISLNCSNDEGGGVCSYMHATNFESKEGIAIHAFERLTAMMIKKLPDFGPWETFHITEGENKRRSNFKRRNKK
jgi:hypothetical protein